MLTFSGQIFAQKYKQLPKPDATKSRELASQIRGMVDGRAAMDQTLMVDWYGRVGFASMTQPSQFENLPKWRGMFIKDLQKSAQRNPALYTPLRDFVLKIATTMINPAQDPAQEYHPAVR